MKPQTKIQTILSALRAFALSAVFAAALIALAPAAFAETKTERLLGEPLNEFAVDENGWTHLHWAAVANDEESVRRLLEMGAPVDFKNNGDGSDFSDEANLRLAVVLGEKQVNENRDGMTPLLVALYHGTSSIPLVSILIDGGANVNARHRRGHSPLHLAAHNNAPEVAALLLENGANVNARNRGQQTPLYFAARMGALETAALLLENGANVNAGSGSGRKPLHVAAGGNWTEVAALLLKNGADVNAKGEDDLTPLHFAAANNATETAVLLLENGAEVNAESGLELEWKSTPLDDANYHEMQALLRKHGGLKRSELPRE